MKTENKTKKINENIKRIKAYFEKEVKEHSTKDLKFIIKEFEVKKEIRGIKDYKSKVISINIITDVENPKNHYLKDRYFILLSTSGKIKFITKGTKKFYTFKKLLNKHYLK